MTVHCKLNVQHTTYCVQVIFHHRSGMVRSVYSVTTSQKDFQVVLPIYMQSIWSCCQSFLNYEREFSVPDIDALVNISFVSFHRLYFVIASILSNSFSLSSFFFFLSSFLLTRRLQFLHIPMYSMYGRFFCII